MNWYLKVLKNYAVFEGRAQRKEYWFFALFHQIIIFVLVYLDILMASAGNAPGVGVFQLVYTLATLLPALAVTVRRLHDTDRSGWWLLLAFIPLIGALILLFFFVQDSTPGKNRFGENPKEFPG